MGLPDLGADQLGVGEVGIDGHDHELVASEPGDGVRHAHRRLEPCRGLLEHDVAGSDDRGVVERLQSVDVEDEKGHRVTGAAGV